MTLSFLGFGCGDLSKPRTLLPGVAGCTSIQVVIGSDQTTQMYAIFIFLVVIIRGAGAELGFTHLYGMIGENVTPSVQQDRLVSRGGLLSLSDLYGLQSYCTRMRIRGYKHIGVRYQLQ